MAQHAVLLRAQRLDRALRGKVEVVGAQAHDRAAERVERVRQQQKLADRVDRRTLTALRVPGEADLHAVDGRDDVVVPRAADNRSRRQLADRPRQHVPGLLPFQRVVYIGPGRVRMRHGREPQLPQPAVGGRGQQPAEMIQRQRLEPDAVAFENDGLRMNHAEALVDPHYTKRPQPRGPLLRRARRLSRASGST